MSVGSILVVPLRSIKIVINLWFIWYNVHFALRIKTISSIFTTFLFSKKALNEIQWCRWQVQVYLLCYRKQECISMLGPLSQNLERLSGKASDCSRVQPVHPLKRHNRQPVFWHVDNWTNNSVSWLQIRIQRNQFCTCILRFKLPVHANLTAVTFLFPCRQFFLKTFKRIDPTGKTLPCHYI